MNSENKYHFNKLKTAISETFLENHSNSSPIESWKGDDIILFQEDLFNKVKARVSEKWFYTYFKNSPQKLPRIDMLNLLSEYAGFKNWADFKMNHKFKKETNNKIGLKVFVSVSIIVIFYIVIFSKNSFHFCFIDDIKNQPITKIPLDIKLLQEKESPLFFKTDSNGCFTYKTKANRIKFVVTSPFHQTDTINRHIDSNDNQTVKLTTDDYALMLHYFTNSNIKDWTKHKTQLHDLISDNAKIYRLFDESIGIELFTKAEFIRTLTLPTNSLKRIIILDRTLENDQIVSLKFIMR